MLTPAFTIDQCEKFLTIVIRVPFAKVSDAEVDIDECDFRFHSKPYFLRLALPCALISTDTLDVNSLQPDTNAVKASYDVDSGSFTICAQKKIPGQHFPDLQFLTKLLSPAGSNHARQPLIQELCADAEDVEEEEEFDWQIDQKPYEEELLSLCGPKYGFANRRSGVFTRLQSELVGAIDLENADEVGEQERTVLRVAAENRQFDEEHYLADLYETEVIENLVQFRPPWTGNSVLETLSTEHQQILLSLPRKTYILDSQEKLAVSFSLVDILFAFAYNCRTTEGENTVESCWTVSKLSATLSWLESFKWSSLYDVIISCYRRSLCFPLHRNWQLTEAVFSDVQQIFLDGKLRILSCLLDVRQILSKSDHQYILNDLYMTDYCVWIQAVSDKRIQTLTKRLQEIVITKSDVNLDLIELETAGSLAVTDASAITAASADNANNANHNESTSDGDDSDSNNSDDDDEDGESNEEEVCDRIEQCDSETRSEQLMGEVTRSRFETNDKQDSATDLCGLVTITNSEMSSECFQPSTDVTEDKSRTTPIKLDCQCVEEKTNTVDAANITIHKLVQQFKSAELAD